jgi:PAS domain S-box-containing protein
MGTPSGEPFIETAYQQRVELALHTAGIGTWEWDARTDRVVWSRDFERLHGFPPGAFGHSLSAYARNIHDEDRAGVVAALMACANGGPDYSVEYRLLSPDGETHHVQANGCRIDGSNLNESRLIGVCRDVTQRVQLLEREQGARREAETSDLHYRMLAATIPQQVWTAGPDGALQFVNQRVVEYFNRPAGEVIGAGWQDVVHPDDLPSTVSRWMHSLSSGEEYEIEFRLRRADGQYRWHLGRAAPLHDSSGTIVRWLGTNTDIDEKKRMLALMSTQVEVAQLLVNARSLDEVSETILQSVCRNLAWTCAQLWIVDRDRSALRRTAGWCGQVPQTCFFDELSTFDRMEAGVGLPGRIWASKDPLWIEEVESDPNFPRAAMLRRLGLRSAFGFPLIVAGEVAAVLELFSAERRPREESTVTAASTFGTQIGQFIQRIAAENELSDALQRLRRLQRVSDVALTHLTLPELFDNLLSTICEAVACDSAVVLLMDQERGELYPASTFGAAAPLSPDVRIRIGESLSGRAAEQRRTVTCRHVTSQEFIRAEVRALALESVVAVPLLGRDRIIGVLMIGAREDIEFSRESISFVELVAQRLTLAIENASLYESARDSNRLKDRFISIASHELRTPMTGIIGWTSILKRETDPLLREEALNWIEQSARAQARLIEDFLDSTRIREGKLTLRCEPIDLSSVVSSAIHVVSSSAVERGVRLEVRPLEVPAPVHGDFARLQQVVLNLLSNAIKFTPSGKSVLTTVGVDAVNASITVRDEGVGIAADFVPRVFNAFEQEERGKALGGLGLGLHIVSTIVKMHGGTIQAHSDGPGTGTSFIVRLPLFTELQGTAEPPRPPEGLRQDHSSH